MCDLRQLNAKLQRYPGKDLEIARYITLDSDNIDKEVK